MEFSLFARFLYSFLFSPPSFLSLFISLGARAFSFLSPLPEYHGRFRSSRDTASLTRALKKSSRAMIIDISRGSVKRDSDISSRKKNDNKYKNSRRLRGAKREILVSAFVSLSRLFVPGARWRIAGASFRMEFCVCLLVLLFFVLFEPLVT